MQALHRQGVHITWTMPERAAPSSQSWKNSENAEVVRLVLDILTDWGKKSDLLTDRGSVWLSTWTALLVVWCLLSEELYMKKNYNSDKYDKV